MSTVAPDPSEPSGSSSDAPPTYGEAIEELETLLEELEGADVDVDRLAERVARGVELVRFCRARLDVVETETEAVVAELATVHPTGHTADPADESDG